MGSGEGPWTRWHGIRQSAAGGSAIHTLAPPAPATPSRPTKAEVAQHRLDHQRLPAGFHGRHQVERATIGLVLGA